MTKAQLAIKKASERVSAYKVNIRKYPSLASGKTKADASSDNSKSDNKNKK